MPFSVCAATLELRGTGKLPDMVGTPFGVPGEEITVSVQLRSDAFAYIPLGNPVVHYFAPATTVPVEIVGSVTGPYPDVSPITRFVALELGTSPSGGDRIGLDVAIDTSATSLFALSTAGQSGFDGSVTPTSSQELFALFADAMRNEQLWQKSASSAVFVGSSQDLLFLGDLAWSLIDQSTADFDADGDVDGRDFLMWQRDPTAGSLAAWQGDYGNQLSTVADTIVPEPAGLVLLALGGLASVQRRPRRA